MVLDREKTKEIVEFIAKLNDRSVEDVYEEIEKYGELEIYTDEDFEFPSGLKYLENLESLTIEAPITKLDEELLKIKSLTFISILATEIKHFEQISEKFFNKKNLEIRFSAEVYKNAPLQIGKGVFGFRDGCLIFSANDDETITIPTFIHEGYGMYLGTGEISVKEFKKVLAGKLDLEKAKSFVSNGELGEGDLQFDTDKAGNYESYWSWRGENPRHFCSE